MQLRHLAAVALALAGSAAAQCGTNQLTSPPNFVANNGSAIGGLAYFTLDVLSPGGVSICQVDVHTTATGAINGLVELHQSITDWNQLTGTNNTAADWCTIGCLAGTSNGGGVGSPMSIINGTSSIELPQGRYLLSVGNGNWNHLYTNGNGANQNISDGNLTFDGGKGANVPYGATLLSPRVINATFHYDVNLSTTPSPCGASCMESTCVSSGTGCGVPGSAATVYENFSFNSPFDLGSNDLLFTAAGGTVGVVSAAGSAIVPAIGPDLGLGDDESSPLIPLGFSLDAFGICADAISVQSNGCIWLGAVGSGDFSQSVAEFESEQARLAPCWTDLRSLTGGGTSGTIHADVVLGAFATITFDRVEEWAAANPVTFQIVIRPASMLVRYDPATVYPVAELVGFHNGVSQVGTLGSDLNGGAVAPVTGRLDSILDLACTAKPVIGGGLGMELSGLPAGGIGAVLAIIGVSSPGVPMPTPPFLAGCEVYIPQNAPSLGLVISASSCRSYPFSIPVPNSNTWLNLPFAVQGAALDVNTSEFRTSQVLDTRVGNY